MEISRGVSAKGSLPPHSCLRLPLPFAAISLPLTGIPGLNSAHSDSHLLASVFSPAKARVMGIWRVWVEGLAERSPDGRILPSLFFIPHFPTCPSEATKEETFPCVGEREGISTREGDGYRLPV